MIKDSGKVEIDPGIFVPCMATWNVIRLNTTQVLHIFGLLITVIP
jgi:hypothetical protein